LNNIKRVAIIGPECTGKSALSQYLAEKFNTAWVPEYARAYIDNLRRHYTADDLLKIAHGQLRMEDEWARDANDVLICDTNLYVIKVWSQFVFGSVEDEILELINKRQYDLYLLTYVDIPWEEDPQREHPQKREELYQIYLNEMKQQAVPFIEIKGDRVARRALGENAIRVLLQKP
jgi:NadR type nicotinamide-nucleotide adenylyltransferase